MRKELGQTLGRGKDEFTKQAAHLGISVLYAGALIWNLYALLRVLQTDGPQTISIGYRDYLREKLGRLKGKDNS